MHEDVQAWLRFAASDMLSVEALHRAGRDLHAMFFLQQAVEKTVKAVLADRTKAAPPRIHNLRALADLAGLSLSHDQIHLLEVLNGYSTESRYPIERGTETLTVTATQAAGYIERAREFIEWLKQQL